MTWFKVDDKLWGHPKWLATPTRARGLWVTAGSWSADQEQDGKIPRHVLPALGGNPRDAAALVESGLWACTPNGWTFHGWADFQPTHAEKETDRAAARERMAEGRRRKAEKRSEDVRANTSERTANRSGNVRLPRPDPTRPDPVVEVLHAVGDLEHQVQTVTQVERETETFGIGS